MILTTIGWAVVHSLWQGALVAGVAALALALLPERRARARYAIAAVGLTVMTAAPIVTALTAVDLMGHPSRQQIGPIVDDAVGMPLIVYWRSIVVPAAALLWIAGVGFGLARVAAEWRRTRSLASTDLEDAAGGAAGRMVAELRRRLGVRPAVRVVRSRRVTVPMVLGWRRPMILLPATSLDGLGAPQLRAVLAHELAHVGRRDYLANLAQVAADVILFHHPAARWVSHRVRIEREYCCDDVAVAIGGVRDYAHALSTIEESRGCLLAVAAGSGTLLDRVQRLAGHPRPVLTPARGAAALLFASTLAAILFVLSMVVPPGLPLDVKMRTRRPPPAGAVLPPDTRSLPRTPGS